MKKIQPLPGKPPGKRLELDRTRPLKGLRILIVEDVGMVAMALKTMLAELGCVVVAMAARLAEAEDLARHETLDGVLLDLNLGGQFAFPVIDILRERNIPFIIMSGYDAGQLRADLAEAPMMQKPFEREALEAIILTGFCTRENDRDHDEDMVPPVSPRVSASNETTRRAAPLKSAGEIEAAVCQGMCRFEQEYIGRGPKDVHTNLIGDLLLVRLQGVLTAAEQHLVETTPVENGRDLLKRVRTLLLETARPQIDSMIQVITGVKVLSMHHDISTITGEEIVVFTLSEAPPCRETKK